MRHIPERMCVICRVRHNKDSLTRFVMAERASLLEDAKKILPGRGYYVCAEGACKEKWLRKSAKFLHSAGKRGRA
jgi:predicted RNA-binding protein YlxR (DUF448 family)